MFNYRPTLKNTHVVNTVIEPILIPHGLILIIRSYNVSKQNFLPNFLIKFGRCTIRSISQRIELSFELNLEIKYVNNINDEYSNKRK